MLIDSLLVFAFGMVGIFAVMGIIWLTLEILNRVSKKSQNDEV